MDKKVYFLHLLILCGILSQGISGLEQNGNSEDLHIRKKRVIGSHPISLIRAPYVISIIANDHNHCTASLLSSELAITSEHCFRLGLGARYSILSASGWVNTGRPHNITWKITHPNYVAGVPNTAHDLVLIRFYPQINYTSSPNRPIKLYNGPLPANSLGTVASWGCYAIIGEEKRFPNQLQSSTLPIMSLQECKDLYRYGNIVITEYNICTRHRSMRCNDGDSGAPLVVNDRIVGVMSWNVDHVLEMPDVFINLLHPEYRSWIAQYVPSALDST